MESILVRALESKLKYWLRSFSREQFKLQGRNVIMYNLDLNGDVLHAMIGLPPTLRVTQARVGKFELKLPSLTLVNQEPITVEIDQLDIVLVETSGSEPAHSSMGMQQSGTPTRISNGYGFADKIADGMTIAVGTVNLMLETRGGSGREGAAWNPPLASITIRNLLLYTTNEIWKVVNLKEAREFFANTQSIYIFKKLEWESLSVDLLPHPDMFSDETLGDTDADINRDNAGARRRFFGGERFLDSISGEAYITMQRTDLNTPVALEVQVVIPEAFCPALSEPGLRALLRFMTGVYVCLNRGDVDPSAEQLDEAAGRTMVKVTVDHIFLCIQDEDFQLELLMQSLIYIRASAAEGMASRVMSRLELGHLFLRDTHSKPSCTLVQPSLRNGPLEFPPIPSFASEKLWPRIYPLDTQLVTWNTPPMMSMFSSQTIPAPPAPHLASQMVVQCQPLMINLQEDSCIRIASFLADGVVVERGVVTPDTSLNAIYISLKEFDVTVPLKENSRFDKEQGSDGFTGARLHIEGFVVAQSPFLSFRLLNLDEDPSCFAFWKGQPVDSSQQRWMVRATHLSIALETDSCDDLAKNAESPEWAAGLWRCVVMRDPCIEAAMVTADGKALLTVPPPGGIVRLGLACKSYTSNTSSEQLFFVVRMYGYMGDVSRTLVRVSKGLESATTSPGTKKGRANPNQTLKRADSPGGLAKLAPDDTAVVLRLGYLEMKLLESIPGHVAVEGPALVQILSEGISLKASHRMLGGAAVLSSTLSCRDVQVECVETDFQRSRNAAKVTRSKDSFRDSSEAAEDMRSAMGRVSVEERQPPLSPTSSTAGKLLPGMRAVLWIGDEKGSMGRHMTANGSVKPRRIPFLDVNVVHVIPLKSEDSDCYSLNVTMKIAGVRMGGGMVYNEALLHRFGILGPDGGPGADVKRILKTLKSGPIAELLRPSSELVSGSQEVNVNLDDGQGWEMGKPDNIDIDLQLHDWIFALEGLEDVPATTGGMLMRNSFLTREQKCWHSTFRCLRVIALSRQSKANDSGAVEQKPKPSGPVQEITMQIEGLQTFKPQLLEGTEATLGRSTSGKYGRESTGGSDGNQANLQRTTSFQPVNLHVTSKSGLDFAANLIENVDDLEGDLNAQWVVESVRMAVKEPLEFKATKAEVEYLVQLGKLEVEAASRVAAGILKLAQLHGPFGQSAIDQLSSIGSGSLESILTPDKSNSRQRRSSSEESTTSPSPSKFNGVPLSKAEPTIIKLQAAVRNSRALCADVESSLSSTAVVGGRQTSSSVQTKAALNDLSLVVDELSSMEALLARLQNDIRSS